MNKRRLNFNIVYNIIKKELNLSNSMLEAILQCNQPLISLFNSNKRDITYNKALLLKKELENRDLNIYKYIFNENDNYLYHGSREGISGDISILKCKKKKADFGLGFYVGESFKQSSTFISIVNSLNKRVYSLSIDLKNLKILDLTPKNRNDFRWMLVIGYFRDYLSDNRFNQLNNQIVNLISKYDVIFGPIADDRLTYSMEKFLDNSITDNQLMDCLTRLKLGNQYCFKNDKAIKRIKIIEEMEIDNTLNSMIKDYQISQYISVNKFTNSLLVSKSKEGKTFDEILKIMEKNEWKI